MTPIYTDFDLYLIEKPDKVPSHSFYKVVTPIYCITYISKYNIYSVAEPAGGSSRLNQQLICQHYGMVV